MNTYQRHPGKGELLYLPPQILHNYSLIEYRYLIIEEYDEIPISKFLSLDLDIGSNFGITIPLKEYAQGFIDGYNSDLVPFIDTPNSRKESIYNEAALKGVSSFPIHYTKKKEYHFEDSDIHECGYNEGRRYKAWEIIFQTPNNFIDLFQRSDKKVLKPINLDKTAGKPVFNTEAIPNIFDILKDHFPKEQQAELKRILETGEVVKEKLFFRDNGKRLAYTFKQLFEKDFITGCNKKELERWISLNFIFRFREKAHEFKPRYLHDIISIKYNFSKKPLLELVLNKDIGAYQIEKA